MLAALTVLAPLVAWGGELVGVPRVIDGDTLVVGEHKLRLQGVDAPETDQVCLDGKGAQWTCGVTARDRLAERIGGRTITCATTGTDAYGRDLATCREGAEDLNRWLVRQGLALAFVRYARTYEADEAAARAGKDGLWAGAFVAPWDWRHPAPGTGLRGAVTPSAEARTALLGGAPAVGAPSPDCAIKGNVNAKGDRIFHPPGARDYAKVRMDKGKGERWFCSGEEAEAAGWRKAAR